MCRQSTYNAVTIGGMENNRGETTTISVRVPLEQHARWKHAADADQRTLNSLVRIAVEAWLKRTAEQAA